jgi:hypothetical protein
MVSRRRIAMSRFVSSLVLTVALAGSVACAARVYDPGYHDYHRWDSHEEASFRVYLGERHMEYRSFDRLNDKERGDYWAWRHDHP